MSSFTIGASYTASRLPKTGLALADINLTLIARKRSDGSLTVLWDGTVHPTEEITGMGVYTRSYTEADFSLNDYLVMSQYVGAQTVDQTVGVGSPAQDAAVATVDEEALARAVWANDVRTLTQILTSYWGNRTTGTLTAVRGDTLDLQINNLGSLVSRTEIYVTLKNSPEDADADALLQVSESGGLGVLAGATAATPGDASLVVADENAGNLNVHVEAAAMATLPSGRLHYDVQVSFGTLISTRGIGIFLVLEDITRHV